MIRKGPLILSIGGLILSVGLWGVSYWSFGYGHYRFDCGVYQGCLYVSDKDIPAKFWHYHINGWQLGSYQGLETRWVPHMRSSWPGRIEYFLPLWLPAVLFAVYPALVSARLFRRWRVGQTGLCPSCSYNLTGSKSARCPECGQPLLERSSCNA